jgi:succinate dehydrogenase / fumarate reductase, membrane anchor subunit
LRLATSDQMTAATWLASPPARHAFCGCRIAHALIGIRSVFLDYVHTRARLLAAELIVRAAATILVGASVLAVLKLFLGR